MSAKKKKNTVAKPSNKPSIKATTTNDSLDIHTNVSSAKTPPGRSTPPSTPLTSQRGNTQVTIFEEEEEEEVIINSENETEYNTQFVEEDDEIQININPKKPTTTKTKATKRKKSKVNNDTTEELEPEQSSPEILLSLASALLLKAVVLLADDIAETKPLTNSLIKVIGIKDFPEYSERYGNTVVYVDVTESEKGEWKKLSSCYPHGRISVGGSSRWTSMTVEGIWSALKVFEHEGVDLSRLSLPNFKGMARNGGGTAGTFVGFAKSVDNGTADTWTVQEAQEHILAPAYAQALKSCSSEIGRLVAALKSGKMIIIIDHADPTKSLSFRQRPLVGSLFAHHLSAELQKKPKKKKAKVSHDTDKSDADSEAPTSKKPKERTSKK